MCPLPAGESIRGEATVDDGHMGLVIGIAEVREVCPQLAWRQQTLKQTIQSSSMVLPGWTLSESGPV